MKEKTVVLREGLGVNILVGISEGNQKPTWFLHFANPETGEWTRSTRELIIEQEWIRSSSRIQRGKITLWMTQKPDFVVHREVEMVLKQVEIMSNELESQLPKSK